MALTPLQVFNAGDDQPIIGLRFDQFPAAQAALQKYFVVAATLSRLYQFIGTKATEAPIFAPLFANPCMAHCIIVPWCPTTPCSPGQWRRRDGRGWHAIRQVAAAVLRQAPIAAVRGGPAVLCLDDTYVTAG